MVTGNAEQGRVLVEVDAEDVGRLAAPPQLRHHLPAAGGPHPHQGSLLAGRGQPGAGDVEGQAGEGAVVGPHLWNTR